MISMCQMFGKGQGGRGREGGEYTLCVVSKQQQQTELKNSRYNLHGNLPSSDCKRFRERDNFGLFDLWCFSCIYLIITWRYIVSKGKGIRGRAPLCQNCLVHSIPMHFIKVGSVIMD